MKTKHVSGEMSILFATSLSSCTILLACTFTFLPCFLYTLSGTTVIGCVFSHRFCSDKFSYQRTAVQYDVQYSFHCFLSPENLSSHLPTPFFRIVRPSAPDTTNLARTACTAWTDLMMAVVFAAIGGLRHAGVGDLKPAIEDETADSFKDW